MSATKTLTALVQTFFTVIQHQRGFSPATVLSYRDAIKLLLVYASNSSSRSVMKLNFKDLDVSLITNFLNYLESERSNQIATRNNRLAAIRSFFSFVAFEEPFLAEQCRRVCAIPLKKGPIRPIPYLEMNEMNSILEAPNQNTYSGRRDYAFLLFLYNTGARVQEMIGVRASDLRLTKPQQVLLRGKGQKERVCPLWKETACILDGLLTELSIPVDSTKKIFLNRYGDPISRFGVDYILKKYAAATEINQPTLSRKRVSSHTIRHTTAVHLLNSGVDINVIRSWLGHVDLKTTNIYAEINLDTKRKALATCAPKTAQKYPKKAAWKKSPDLLAWLESL